MRQTLLRFLLSDLWTVEVREGVPYLGVGWLLIPWALFGVWEVIHFVRSRRSGAGTSASASRRAGRSRSSRSPQTIEQAPRTASQDWLPLGAGWLIVAGVILSLPLWAGGLVSQGLPVYGYGFMLFVGFIAAGWTGARRARRIGIPQEFVWDVTIWIFAAGIVGARLFYLLQYGDRIFADKHGWDVLRAAVNLPDGGLVLYGGVILALAVYLLFCRMRALSPLLMADVMIPSFFVGLGFGRIGCFLNGCCYGELSHLPWAVRFPQGSVPFLAMVQRGLLSPDAAATPPLHPSQLYSSAAAFLLAFATAWYFRRRPQNGAVLGLALLAYPVTRFLIEFVRGDEPGQFGTSLTISQWVSLVMFAGGLVYVWWLRRREGSQTAVAKNAVRRSRR